MLSGFEIFNFFVSDHLKAPYDYTTAIVYCTNCIKWTSLEVYANNAVTDGYV